MTTLVGPAAVAENEAQARNTSNTRYATIVPEVVINGTRVPATHGYAEARRKWTIMRDCFAGELRIKEKGETYLPRPSNVDPKDFGSFLDRASYYNATRRTHSGLVGAMIRKNPEVKLPTNSNLDLNSVTREGLSFKQFVREISSEMLLVSRFGILTDIPQSTPAGTAPKPYFAGYRAESIFAIRERLVNGVKVVDRVVLLEEEFVQNDYGTEANPIIRVLRLDPVDANLPNGKQRYWQQIVRPNSSGAPGPSPIQDVFVRTQGRELDYIPFVLVNPFDHLPAICDPVLFDLAMINISHFQSSALLEHGRFYAGMPTYYLAGEGASNDPLSDVANGLGSANPMTVGPSNVWMLETGDKCGLLEFTGHGLTFLENAVDSKQLQMQSLGGKLIPTQRRAAALSTEAYGLMETGDEATLLDVTLSIESALTKSLNYSNDLANNEERDALCELNKEFIRSELTAREVRAIQTLYERRLIPKDVLYYTLRQIGIIPMEYTLDQFTKLLGTPSQLYEEPEVQPVPGGPKNNPADPNSPAQRAALQVRQSNTGIQE